MNRVAQFLHVSPERFCGDWRACFPEQPVPDAPPLPRRATAGSAGYDFFSPLAFRLEPGESEEGCCMREVAEETGYTVSLSPCLLEIDEYYGDMKYVSRYFSGTVTGRCETALTEAEKRGGLEPRWLPAPDALGIFSAHSDPGCKDEVKRGIYEREYEALRRILGTHS